MRPDRKRLSLSALVLVVTSGIAIAFAQPGSLDEVRATVAREFPGVPVVSPRALAAALAGAAQRRPVLLDARTPEEFAVSHLRGASRVDPDHPDVAAILRMRPRSTVVYCSVGYRSARVAERLLAAGLTDVRNLDGGIFAWVAAGLPVVRGRREVHDVHPYDARWGALLRPDYRTRTPR